MILFEHKPLIISRIITGLHSFLLGGLADVGKCYKIAKVSDVIYQTRGRVFHQDMQTPRSVLKNEAVGRVF